MERVSTEAVAALERGATVVTGNQRAARTLRQEFDLHQRAQGRTSWQPARVMTWEAWLERWWNSLIVQGRTRRMVLNRSQELAVWRSILEADEERQSLRGVESLAEMAADAWGLLCRYNGVRRLRELGVSTDTRAFQRWAQAFERRCRAEELLTQAGLTEALQQGLVIGEFEPEGGELALLGFDRFTPAQSSLLEALREGGVGIVELAARAMPDDRMLVTAADEDAELQACAHWTRQLLEEQPEARIAVVVPGLEAERSEIDRVFRGVLAPELEDIAGGPPPFEFSIGVSLASTPMVLAALDLLRWIEAPLPLERVSSLLLSPYFADGRKDWAARAALDAFGLRQMKLLRPEISLDALVDLVEDSQGLSNLSAALHRMGEVWARRLSKDEALPRAEWAEAIREWLTAAAWGAGHDTDTIEFQTRMKWESVLDESATLDFDGTRVRFGEAVATVERVARRTLFAAESRETPVQILGPLEAAGSQFDAVWFLRAGEMSWPMATAPSSLLPWGMQRELQMPGADPAHELAFARDITDRIARSAEIVVFSYARLAGEDSGKQRVSAALARLRMEDVTAGTILADHSPEGGFARQIVALELVEDDVRLPPLPDRVMRGGAALLAAQAACGFRAFAEQRLWSTEPETTELGMNALQRGTLVHAVLERFWKDVKTQETLREMTDAEREDVLAWCITEEMQKRSGTIANAWDAAYVDMERGRLQTLLGQWLELELTRPPFVVKLNEMPSNEVPVGPLRLNVIVDRIDLVDDGGGAEGEDTDQPAEMILDYKTGQADPKQWLGPRPDAPQLPLYAVLSDAPRLAAVAFAKIRLGEEMSLQGYATSEELVTKFTKLKDAPTLEMQVAEWRRVLTRLAEEFASGDVRVRPKQYPVTCTHCAQRLVCRLDVAALEADGDDEAAESDE